MSSAGLEFDSTTATKTRRRLQDLLRHSDSDLDVYDLAGATGLHITTVRFHLDVLLRAGVVTTRTLARSTPGRPRSVYTLRLPEPSVEPYEPLVALLAANLGSTSEIRRRRAEKAGRDWAVDLVPDETPSDESSGSPTDRIARLFSQMQFDPEPVEPIPETGEQEIRLRACPFRDVALIHPEVICAIHLGLLQGALTRLGGRTRTAQLLPFVEPTLCVVRISSEQPPNGAPQISA